MMTKEELHKLYSERWKAIDDKYEVDEKYGSNALQQIFQVEDMKVLLEGNCPEEFQVCLDACLADGPKPTHFVFPMPQAKRLLDGTQPQPDVPASVRAQREPKAETGPDVLEH